MIKSLSENIIPKADIFWDSQGWYWVEYGKSICENSCNTSLHDAIVDCIRNGYEIRDVRGSRGSVKIRNLY